MIATLDLTGKELVLLYIATGNASARELILRCIQDEREFNTGLRVIAKSLTATGKRKEPQKHG